ncbi:hypothetical protein pipiens_020384, partial [Culex pipiens pipiens]
GFLHNHKYSHQRTDNPPSNSIIRIAERAVGCVDRGQGTEQ